MWKVQLMCVHVNLCIYEYTCMEYIYVNIYIPICKIDIYIYKEWNN